MNTFYKKDIFAILFIAAVYFLLSGLFINAKLLGQTFFGYFSLSYKTSILLSLVLGIFTSQTPTSLFLLLILATLTAVNIVLVIKKISILKKMKRLRLITGGGMILGIAGSGCSVCGLSLLSLLGMGGVFAGLPFVGREFQLTGIFLLLVSIFFLTKNNEEDAKKCRISPSRRRGRSA